MLALALSAPSAQAGLCTLGEHAEQSPVIPAPEQPDLADPARNSACMSEPR